MTKKERQKIIIKLIENVEIETQEDLVYELNKVGCIVTQATASRDIKELKLLKIDGNEKQHRYVQHLSVGNYNNHSKYGNIFKESVVSLSFANNLIVIKTVSGAANSACVFIDNLAFPEILGTIAGDDIILCVATSNENAKKVLTELKKCF